MGINNEKPLISCIMPTANRAKFVPYAVQQFLRQNYEHKELVILDDGVEPVEYMIPLLPQVRYERLSTVAVTGAKRNYACEMSKGEIILHWDDDDWHADDWISRQVTALVSSGAQISGLAEVFFYDPSSGKSWVYTYPPGDRAWVYGASMIYYKEHWRRHPFKNVQIGEDNSFAWDSKGAVIAHHYSEGMVAIVHAQNTSPKKPGSTRWKPIPVKRIEDILKSQIGFYHALEHKTI